MWSRNKANLYIRDALDDFHYDPKALISPPKQYKMYKQKLMATHLIGFGSGVGVSAPVASSYEFDGSGDKISCPDHNDFSDIGTGNFTIDMWAYFSTLSATAKMCIWYTGGIGIYWVIYDSGLIDFYGGDPSGSINPIGSTGAVSTGAWTHLAFTKNSSSGKMWVDGVEDAEDTTSGGNLGDASSSTLAIGQGLDGYIDEFRFSNTARWSADFSGSLPTGEYTSDANTIILIHCNETIVSGTTGSGATFVDSGNTGHTFTEGGDAIRNTSTYKF